MQLIKLIIDYSDEEVYLPLAENLAKGRTEPYENFAALKKDWESLQWGYTSKVEVTLVETMTQKEFDLYQTGKTVDMFDNLPKTEPIVLDLQNPSDVVECDELDLICFKELAIQSDLYKTPQSEKPQEEDYYSCTFAIDCKRGQVYSKDFAYFDCPCCQRTICEQNPANGWMNQCRTFDNEDSEEQQIICSKCFEEAILTDGLEVSTSLKQKKINGSWFTDSELEEAGYTKVIDDEMVGSGRSGYNDPDNFWKLIQEMQDKGDLENKVLAFQFDSMAIGGMGGYVSVWTKEKVENKIAV